MGLLSFLSTASIEDAVVQPKRNTSPKQRNPNPALLAVRVWKDGSIFPSQALVDKFDLEYRGAEVEQIAATEAVGKEGEEGYQPARKAAQKTTIKGNPGFGFDVIDTRALNGYKAEGDLLLISPVKRGEPKIDLFASTVYDENGNPKSKVMDQGALTFGSQVLVPAIEELYGIKFHKAATDTSGEVEGVQYVDMVVTEEIEGVNVVEKFSKDILFAPKRIVRGERKGQSDYVRREHATVYGFVPAQLLGTPETEGTAAEEETEELDELLA